ncbi:unnamed protein product, partial [Vitis vinifera]|uniref:Uncharacterized protein n=1 Tax=Vitis vinifera TaxID=29760 RepID=D7SVR4_VITVI
MLVFAGAQEVNLHRPIILDGVTTSSTTAAFQISPLIAVDCWCHWIIISYHQKMQARTQMAQIDKEAKLSFEKTVGGLPKSIDGTIRWHHADTSIGPLSWLVGSGVVVVDPPRKGLDPSLVDALRSYIN